MALNYDKPTFKRIDDLENRLVCSLFDVPSKNDEYVHVPANTITRSYKVFSLVKQSHLPAGGS